MPQITTEELEHMPTLAQGQAADLKIDTTFTGGAMRVWVSRCGIYDGETQPVQVERLVDGRWEDITGDADPRASSFKTHYLDGGFEQFFVTCITRKFIERR